MVFGTEIGESAVISAIVHNDYTREVPPKVELFSDRLEITSFGRLPEGLTREDFFTLPKRVRVSGQEG